jgi:pyruvate dehydrogenase E1 component alpha subunit
VPPETVKAEIMAGRSIALCFPEYRFLSSAIVGGNLPIALGIALAIKRRGGDEHVWAFCGDMTARTGIYHECLKYAVGHELPIRFIIEDNGLSVCTPTQDVWGGPRTYIAGIQHRYHYKLPFPHSGAGTRVQF